MLKSLLSLLSLSALLITGFASAASDDDIAARLQPAGKVCAFGDPCASGKQAASAAGDSKSPEGVYNTFCQACHLSGANNAPLFGDKAAWAPRIAKGMDALYESALNGFNGGLMPVRGTCVACTDDELKATVDHMVNAAK